MHPTTAFAEDAPKAAATADAPPNPQTAKAVSDLMQKHDEVVKAADAQTIKSLKKLLAKSKKDTASTIMIAVRIHKLDPEDQDSLAILKDVPADQQDLLGNQTEPGKYMTDVQAKAIKDALEAGKFSDKDWDALPGIPLEVKPTGSKASLEPGKYLVVPNQSDTWSSGPREKAYTYLGIDGVIGHAGGWNHSGYI
jgi:hypothetical protein